MTLISPIKPVREHENITLIKIDGVREHFIEMGYEKNYNFDRKDLTIIPSVVNLLYKNAVLADFILGQQVVVDLLKSDQKFDLFISDFQFTDCLLGYVLLTLLLMLFFIKIYVKHTFTLLLFVFID